MKRKRTFKSLVREADKLFSLAVRKRDEFSVFSGKPSECCFHIVSRVKYATRWDLENAVGSTFGENYEMEFNPNKYIRVLIARKGLAWYEALVDRSNKIAKFGRGDLEQIISGLKAKQK
jgi:hypothetical protein